MGTRMSWSEGQFRSYERLGILFGRFQESMGFGTASMFIEIEERQWPTLVLHWRAPKTNRCYERRVPVCDFEYDHDRESVLAKADAIAEDVRAAYRRLGEEARGE